MIQGLHFLNLLFDAFLSNFRPKRFPFNGPVLPNNSSTFHINYVIKKSLLLYPSYKSLLSNNQQEKKFFHIGPTYLFKTSGTTSEKLFCTTWESEV